MAISANGLIARSDDTTTWVSQEEWASYHSMISRARCLVIGRRTYQVMVQGQEFAKLNDVTVVVVSREGVQLVAGSHQMAHSPQQALDFLKNFG